MKFLDLKFFLFLLKKHLTSHHHQAVSIKNKFFSNHSCFLKISKTKNKFSIVSDEEREYLDGLCIVPVMSAINPDIFKGVDLPLGFFLLARKVDDIYGRSFFEKDGKVYKNIYNLPNGNDESSTRQSVVYNANNRQLDENSYQNVYNNITPSQMNNNQHQLSDEKTFQTVYNKLMNYQKEDKSFQNLYMAAQQQQQMIQQDENKKHRKNSYTRHVEQSNKQEAPTNPHIYKYSNGK
jgi:hypothetical protein